MKRIFTSFLFFVLVLSLAILDAIFSFSKINFLEIFINSLLLSLPIIIMSLVYKPGAKKIFWVSLGYSVGSAILVSLIYLFVLGDYWITPLGILMWLLRNIVFYSILSVLVIKLTYLNNKIIHSILIILISLLLVGSIVKITIYFNSCGKNGCADVGYLSELAYKNNDLSICERSFARPGYKYDGIFPDIAFYKFSSFRDYSNNIKPEWADGAGTVGCYLKYAEFFNNQEVCDQLRMDLRDICFKNLLNKGVSLQCDKFNNKYSRSICYYALAIYTGNKEFCNEIENVSDAILDKNERLPKDAYLGSSTLYNINKEFCLNNIK